MPPPAIPPVALEGAAGGPLRLGVLLAPLVRLLLHGASHRRRFVTGPVLRVMRLVTEAVFRARSGPLMIQLRLKEGGAAKVVLPWLVAPQLCGPHVDGHKW